MSKPKVIIFGYDELLLSSLDIISQAETEISAVVFPSNRTDPRIGKIRNMVKARGFKTLRQPPRKQLSKFAGKLRAEKPDLIFVWSYTMILPAEVIEIPRLGAVNLHMGLLPEYRGVNGIRWALINGESETGVTLHFMDPGIDTGDIISKSAFPIEPDDDILSLMIKSRAAGSELLNKNWEQIAIGSAAAKPQDESRAGYYSAKMSDIKTVDWSQGSKEIDNLIRASAIPFPGVSTYWKNQKLTLRKAIIARCESQTESVGTLKNITSEGLEVVTGNGSLLICKIEIDGENISVSDLIKLGLKPGVEFSDC